MVTSDWRICRTGGSVLQNDIFIANEREIWYDSVMAEREPRKLAGGARRLAARAAGTRETRGFTLIELLVVIAIIAMLMGILVPVLRKVREQGKDVVCRNNMRQIGLAANFYADHFDLYIPRSAEWGGRIKPWFQLFMPFLAQDAINDDYRSVDIFRCPSYPDKEQTVCYVVNGWRDGSGNSGGMQRVASKLTACDSPASTIYLADNEDGPWRTIIKKATDRDVTRCDVFRESHLPMSESRGTGDGRRVARARHKSGCNILYLDFHVAWIAAEEMTSEMWSFER